MSFNDSATIVKLLHAIAGGTEAQNNKHDVIFIAVAEHIERLERSLADVRIAAARQTSKALRSLYGNIGRPKFAKLPNATSLQRVVTGMLLREAETYEKQIPQYDGPEIKH